MLPFTIFPLLFLWTSVDYLVLVKCFPSFNHYGGYFDGVNDYYTLSGRGNGVRRDNQRSQTKRPAVVATFRFEQKANGGKKSGWHVSGCYCPASSFYCDCSRATARVNMMINPRQTRSGNRGNGAARQQVQSKRIVRYRERVRGKNGTVRTKSLSIRSGCFCDSLGCRGTSCNRLNGCVCNDDNGVCWGKNCPVSRRINTDRSLDSLSVEGTSDDHSTSMTGLDLPSNSGLLVDPITSLFGIDNRSLATKLDGFKLGESSEQINAGSLNLDDGCFCDDLGCKGSGCSQMNGCFCGPDKCWGLSCGSSSSPSLEEDFIFRRKKFPSLGLGDDSLDEKVTTVKSKFENLWNSKKNMMSSMGNKFGGLVGSKVNMVQSKLNGIAGTKVHLVNSVGNSLTDLAAQKGSMALPNKFNLFKGKEGNKAQLTMNEVITTSDPRPQMANSQTSSDIGMNKISNAKTSQSEGKSTSLDDQSMIMVMKSSNNNGLKSIIDGMSGKMATRLTAQQQTDSEYDQDLFAKPVTNIDGKMEAMLGNKVDVLTGRTNNIVTADAKAMKNLVGHVIPVIKAYPIESITGVPIPQIQGTSIGSVPSMPVEAKNSKPIYHHPNHNYHSQHSSPTHQQQQPQTHYQQPSQHYINFPTQAPSEPFSHPHLSSQHQQHHPQRQVHQISEVMNAQSEIPMHVDVSPSKLAGVATLNPISRISTNRVIYEQPLHQHHQMNQMLISNNHQMPMNIDLVSSQPSGGTTLNSISRLSTQRVNHQKPVNIDLVSPLPTSTTLSPISRLEAHEVNQKQHLQEQQLHQQQQQQLKKQQLQQQQQQLQQQQQQLKKQQLQQQQQQQQQQQLQQQQLQQQQLHQQKLNQQQLHQQQQQQLQQQQQQQQQQGQHQLQKLEQQQLQLKASGQPKESDRPTVIIRASPNGSIPSVTIRTVELLQSKDNLTRGLTMVS